MRTAGIREWDTVGQARQDKSCCSCDSSGETASQWSSLAGKEEACNGSNHGRVQKHRRQERVPSESIRRVLLSCRKSVWRGKGDGRLGADSEGYGCWGEEFSRAAVGGMTLVCANPQAV
jgi:hypothetical protein